MPPDRLRRLFVELRRTFFITTISKWTQLWYSLRMEMIIGEIYRTQISEQSFKGHKPIKTDNVKIDITGEVDVSFPHLSDPYPVDPIEIYPALTRIDQ